jgi:hypothetical protein
MHQASIVREAFKLLRAAVDSPYTLTGLGSMPQPGEYVTPKAFALDYCVYTYLRKLKGSKADDAELERQAILGFKETESFVAQTNLRLRSELSGYPGAERLISDVRSKISSILGRFCLDEMAKRCEWGPGATSSLKANDARVDKKILEPRISITARALPYAISYLKYDLAWFSARCGMQIEGPYEPLLSNFLITRSSRLTTVEKNIKERRIIDIQPTFNLFLQKGVGSMIRSRLQRVGVDLDSQSRNQVLAQLGLRLGLATIDLSKASDTISYELVRQLLPADWFAVLHDLRTDSTSYQGDYHHLSKFSAMGNGFTFELESLIFHALCITVMEYEGVAHLEHGIYGDDIIIPRSAVKCLYHCFRLFGFVPNVDKSWSTTLFRESCGKHFFDGIDVTPIYQKVEVTNPLELAAAGNRLLRWVLRICQGELDCQLLLPYLAIRDCFHLWIDRASPIMKRTRRRPSKFRPLQPIWADGDRALIDPMWKPGFRDSLIVFDCFLTTPVAEEADNFALYALSLRRGVVTEAPFLGLASRKGSRVRIGSGEGYLLNDRAGFPNIV